MIIEKVKRRPKNYLSNSNILIIVAEAKEVGYVTDALAKVFMLLAERFIRGSQWRGYTYVDDFYSSILTMLCNGWKSFNPEKSDNPFAYFTQISKNACIRVLNNEKKASRSKDSAYKSFNELNDTGYYSKSELFNYSDGSE